MALDPSGSLLAAGDWQGSVYLWNARPSEQVEQLLQQAQAAEADTAAADAGKRKKARADSVTGSGSSSAGGARAALAAMECKERKPLLTLSSQHSSGPASGLAWTSPETLATGGWDGCIRVQDIERSSGGSSGSAGKEGEEGEEGMEEEKEEGAAAAGGAGKSSSSSSSSSLYSRLVTVMHAPKPVTSLRASEYGSLLASGHTDGVVRVWDSRGRRSAGADSGEAGSSAAASLSLKLTAGLRAALGGASSGSAMPAPAVEAGCTGWVTDASWCSGGGGQEGETGAAAAGAGAGAASHYIAASYQGGGVALWDTRSSSAPLFVLHSHREAAAAGAGAGGAAAGGAGAAPTPGTSTSQALAVSWAQTLLLQGGASGSGMSGSLGKLCAVSGGSDKQLKCSYLPSLRL